MQRGRRGVEGRDFVLEQGRVLAKKYVLERPAGFGGMSQLWVATNRATGAEVCVKLLVPEPEKGGHDEESVERFRREAHAAARLSHRAIVRVFDLLELDEGGEASVKGQSPYAYAIVMELLHGETLGDLLAKRGTIPLPEALDLFLPVLSALGHAHRAAVIHRDLKPDNIFLATDPDGHVIPKVLDFGVSKLETASAITIDGVLVGTPSFMSPEQAKGARSIDARSDVFSLGILLYMMLGGSNPFEDAPTFAATIDAVLRREVPPIPDLAPPIWSVIHRAIEKEPRLRFDDASEMAVALRAAAGLRPAESNPADPSLPPSSRWASAPGAVTTSTHATPSPPPSAVDIPFERASDRAARWRRAIVAGVVSASAVLLLAALTVSAGAKGPVPAQPVDKEGARGASAQAVVPIPPAEVAEPAAVASAAVVAPAGRSTVVPSPSASAAVHVPAATAPGRPAASPRRGASGPVNPSPARKPGQEPHNARDPGF